MKRYLLLLSLFTGLHVLAWGPTGHRVVGKVAESHLTKKTTKNIRRILGNESLPYVANWMDDIKSDKRYDHMNDWHWVTIPNGQTYSVVEKNKDGDIVMTLNRVIAELKTGGLGQEEEIENIKILVHLVGDLHQPLHVGTGEDTGGNSVRVKWFGRNSNLHRVWDSEVIDSWSLSYTELAEMLDHPTQDQIQGWQMGTIEDWAHEMKTYRPQVYDLPESMSLGYEYRYINKNIFELQLLKAGVRLAGILNEIYG